MPSLYPLGENWVYNLIATKIPFASGVIDPLRRRRHPHCDRPKQQGTDGERLARTAAAGGEI